MRSISSRAGRLLSGYVQPIPAASAAACLASGRGPGWLSTLAPEQIGGRQVGEYRVPAHLQGLVSLLTIEHNVWLDHDAMDPRRLRRTLDEVTRQTGPDPAAVCPRPLGIAPHAAAGGGQLHLRTTRLDPLFLRRRRHQLCLTRRQLAREAGVNIETIENAEEHGMPVYDSITLALSRQLGIDLTNPDPYVTTANDTELLGGILAELRQPVRTHAIAEALDWTPARVQATSAQLRTELQQLGQTVTQTADGRLSIAAFQVNLTDRQRERIRSHVLRIDVPAAQVIYTVITGRRAERYRGDLDKEEHHAATELIAAGVIVSYHDELAPSQRLEAAIDNFPLQQLRW
jgi:transcriptional regulator with XRE-family HTH domain